MRRRETILDCLAVLLLIVVGSADVHVCRSSTTNALTRYADFVVHITARTLHFHNGSMNGLGS